MKRNLARAGVALLTLITLILVARALRPAPDTPIAFIYQLPGSIRLEAIAPDGSNRSTLSGSNTTPTWLSGLASRLPAAQQSNLRPTLYADLLRAPAWIGRPASVAFQSRQVGANCEHVLSIRPPDDKAAEYDCLPANLRPEDFAWAPNGSAYAYTTRDASRTELWITAVDGEILHNSPLPSSIWGLSWSPDSNHLAVNLNNELGIRIYSPFQFLYELQAPNYAQGLPAWSPTGEQLVFAATQGQEFNDLYVIDADGSGLLQLTTHPDSDSEPAWSPDGSSLVFTSNRDGNWELYTIRVDGTGLTRLTDTPGDELEPTWRPDPGAKP